ncbi:hypothetical protein EC973_002086 [Apophysomyces ossiformis]|uniref:Uncharacterized protein n=1 Tax=Apophysomyces ossiformis TaxID=679940 RepID=A0A8H7BSV2_9FUNG|nr:hypothetical protein EC973_002086 [Apophysomyces ossiformis]
MLGRTVKLSAALKTIDSTVASESPTVTDFEDLKSGWQSRLAYTYHSIRKGFPNQSDIPKIDYDVSQDEWIKLYSRVVENEILNDKKLAQVGRLRTTSKLYKSASEDFGREILQEASNNGQTLDWQTTVEDNSIEDIPTEEATPKKFRSTVFQTGYQSFRRQLSFESLAKLNTMARRTKPASLGEWVDMFSVSLINSDLSKARKEVLKIVYLVGGESIPLYENFFCDKSSIYNKWLEAKSQKPELGQGMTNNMHDVLDEIIKKAAVGKLEARKLVCQKKLQVLDTGVNDNELLQMLDIMDTVIADLPDHNEIQSRRATNKSELTHYRHVAKLLDIMFRDTNFDMEDGETCSKATKAARQYNMNMCGDNEQKQTVIGRRIDLLISKMAIELGSSEWKKENVAPSVGRQQQIKNARTNKAILRALERMPVDDDKREELFVLGMDWLGSLGYMIAIKQFDSAYVAYFMGDLILPPTLSNLGDFKQTLDLLFAYKHHHVQLEKILEPAYHRNKAQSILQHYRSPAIPKRDLSPDTFFTPVKKQRVRKVFEEEEEEEEGGDIDEEA